MTGYLWAADGRLVTTIDMDESFVVAGVPWRLPVPATLSVLWQPPDSFEPDRVREFRQVQRFPTFAHYEEIANTE